MKTKHPRAGEAPTTAAVIRLAFTMPRNKAILLVILAVNLRIPTVLFRLDELFEPILQFLLRADRQVEL
jgi:hypothetical protein